MGKPGNRFSDFPSKTTLVTRRPVVFVDLCQEHVGVSENNADTLTVLLS